jgi:hypothetical protein
MVKNCSTKAHHAGASTGDLSRAVRFRKATPRRRRTNNQARPAARQEEKSHAEKDKDSGPWQWNDKMDYHRVCYASWREMEDELELPVMNFPFLK